MFPIKRETRIGLPGLECSSLCMIQICFFFFFFFFFAFSVIYMHFKYEPCHEKRGFIICINAKGSDKPMQLHTSHTEIIISQTNLFLECLQKCMVFVEKTI